MPQESQDGSGNVVVDELCIQVKQQRETATAAVIESKSEGY